MHPNACLASVDQANALLGWLCTEWGFCDARHQPADTFIGIDPATFATRVLKAEGMDPDANLNAWHKRIADKACAWAEETSKGAR